MKKVLVSIFLIILPVKLISQVTNEGTPKSWDLKNSSIVPTITLPEFDLQPLIEEDKLMDKKGLAPWRFGKKFEVNYNFSNSGIWDVLPNGDRIWRVKFYSPGAQSLNFILENFYIPEGATIYLYASDKSDLLGAYTHTQNNEYETLGTWLVMSDEVVIEYYEPAAVFNQGRFTITAATHGYRTKKAFTKGLNTSGICNHDVNCPIGPLDVYKDINKKSVAMIISGGDGFCTGALVNNTAFDGKRYFLTANHCYSNPATWSFRFNWISTNAVCGTLGYSIDNGPTNYYTISGATLRARRSNTDFCLVEINNPFPPTWDLVWAGWDRTTTPATSSFGIHHPDADIMKVCREDDPLVATTFGGVSSWRVTDWDLGVTEGGSSGSPLFNQDGRIVGQLYGGYAACSGTTDNGQPDYYGRFDLSWTGGGTNSTRLSNWLDPLNTGATSIGHYSNNLSIDELTFSNDIQVFPNPASNKIFVRTNDSDHFTDYKIYNSNGQLMLCGDYTLSQYEGISINQLPKGIYFIVLKGRKVLKQKFIKN